MQLCGIGNNIAGNDARSYRSKFVERFAVAVLQAGQAVVLPVSRRDVVADCVAKYVVKRVLLRVFVEVFASLADYDTELALEW
jgi:hypothetical protein